MVRIEWRLDRVKRIAAVVLALAVVAVAVPLLLDWREDRQAEEDQRAAERENFCAKGIARKPVGGKRGGSAHERGNGEERRECVGVTDGSYVFYTRSGDSSPSEQERKDLKEVMRKIEKENRRVERETKKYVSVAYVTTLTLQSSDSNPQESVLHELQGAHAAQLRHNTGDRSAHPKMRLLVGNVGSESAHWKHTADELLKLRDTPDRLVAVTGLGPSTGKNRAMVRRLSENGLATVASTMTASNFKHIEYFVRVSAPNEEEAKAAARYLKKDDERSRGSAVIVRDRSKNNHYAQNLGPAFEDEFTANGGKVDTTPELTFNSEAESAWRSKMHMMPRQLCAKDRNVIFFSGRGMHLTAFLKALRNRTECQKQNFTVITGDDTTNLTERDIREAEKTGIEVIYAGLAHPDVWKDREDEKPSPAITAVEKVAGSTDDGQALVAHDAVITVAQALTMLTSKEGRFTGESVGEMFYSMKGDEAPGASGPLSFDENGTPRDKVIPILRLTKDGRTELEDVSWPEER
ncbi:branched-chain amino acid ABC transporter substrate-binding protein [Streptomyces sp. AJS327]|uniref:ABC transporter substrate-binding protein n=1 Tax=Streptomyces sp. AJS327 TaxID=2545265 RepID=UPI0015DF2020|nr:ABC transporter substrate-binding protein [Streptomyces sp. AJS327]MBA0052062.1 branched-chain amino acid ABC transporter substrate-binding protein [Streptomyces sp. AJS327]